MYYQLRITSKRISKESLINYMLRCDGPLEIRKLFLLMTRLKITLEKVSKSQQDNEKN